MQPLTADDIAESVYWAATLPPHVNVNTIELMPVAQSFAPFQVARDPATEIERPGSVAPDTSIRVDGA
jgi:hypothetical protein